MQSVHLLSGLEFQYAPDVAARILTALRQDELVWGALETEEFCQRALDAAHGNSGFWTPANLALIALGGDLNAEVLASTHFPVLEATLRKQAVRAFEDSVKQGLGPSTLREAGLLALALRERRRMTGNWVGLAGELLYGSPDGKLASVQTWNTPLACLAGYVPDSAEMISSLIKFRDTGAAAVWVLHILLTQPGHETETAKRLAQVLSEVPVPRQLDVLKILKLRYGEKLAARTAELILNGHALFSGFRMKVDLDQISIEALSGRALVLQQLASFHALVGSPAQAQACLKLARGTLQYWQAGVDLQAIGLDSINGDSSERALPGRILAQVPYSKRISKELSTVLVGNLDSGMAQDPVVWVDDEPTTILLKALKAQKDNEPGLMRELGARASFAFLYAIRDQELPFVGEFVFSWKPIDFVQALMSMGLDNEAEICAEAALKISPADPNLLSLFAKLLKDHGKFLASKQMSHLAVTLAPTNLALRRRLAEADEKVNDWEAAYRHRKDCLNSGEALHIEDQLAFAKVAIQIGKADEAVDICRKILALDPEQPGAHGWLGMGLARMGQRTEAASHLQRATLLASDEAEWWLMLADMHVQAGDRRVAYESLRAAVVAVPESGVIYTALGDLLLEDHQPAEALPYLKRANELLPDDEQIGLKLSKTLHILGHLGDARYIIEKLRHKWVLQPELAFEFAKMAIEQDDTEGALPALEVAVRSEQANPNWLMAYAGVLLTDHPSRTNIQPLQNVRYEKAEQVLRKVLDVRPTDLQGRILMADALRKRGIYDQALELYLKLAEDPEVVEDEQLWKVQHGLGLTALELNMTEPALVAIKEAAARRPDDIELQHDLARASLAVSLPHEATSAAMTALELAPHDLRNLAWFADMMSQLGRYDHAEEALGLAVDLAPGNPELRLSLAQAQMQSENLSGSRRTLLRLTGEPGVSGETLCKAANVYLRMDELQAALECLERAASLASDPAPELMYDLATLYDRIGKPIEALEAIQTAAGPGCKNGRIFLLKAELLSGQMRYPAALAALKDALRLAIYEPENKRSLLEAEIYEKMARCQIEVGSFWEALQSSENALVLNPGALKLRIQAADLALQFLSVERAHSLSALPEEISSEGTDEDVTRLALIRAETSLELGKLEEAVRAWGEAEGTRISSGWLEAIESRLFLKSGDWIRGVEVARKALKNPATTQSEYAIWVAKAAVAAGLWKEGFQLLEFYAQATSGNPRAEYELGKANVLAAERERDCQLLGCLGTQLNRNLLSESSRQTTRKYFEKAYEYSHSSDVMRWLARGELIFAPNAQGVRDFERIAATAEDSAAVVRAWRELGNWASASLYAQQYPEAMEVQLQIGLAFLTEDPEQGYELAKRMMEKFPNQPLLHVLSAKLAETCGKLADATDLLDEAVRLWPEESGWHAKTAELKSQIGDTQGALHSWRMAVCLAPEQAGYLYALGKLCLETGDYPSAIEALGTSVRIDGENMESWLALAMAYQKIGNVEEAMRSAQNAYRLNTLDVRSVLLCSEIAGESGDNTGSSEYARQAIQRAPRDPNAVLALSKALVRQGLEKESLERIEEHIAELPPFLPLLFERARLVYKLHGAVAASNLLIKLAQLYPDDAAVLALLANVQVESNDLKGAERSAFRSLRLNPRQPQLSLMLAKLIRGSGQLDQVVHLLSEAIRMQPDNIEAYLELGQTYLERREHEAALKVYQRAIQAVPKDPRGYFKAAVIYKDSKDYIAAEAMLQQAAKMDPDNIHVRRQLISVMALNLIHKSQEANTVV